MKQTGSNLANHGERALEAVGLLALTGVVVVTIAQVFTRFVLRSPLTWTEEIARFLEAWVVFLGSFFALKKGLHVSVDYFVKLMPERLQRIVAVITHVLILIFLLVVLRATVTLIQEIWSTKSTAAGYPAPLLPAALFLGGLGMVVETVRQLVVLIRGRTPGKECEG